MVEAIEIDIGEALAGEITDWESSAAFEGCEQGIAGEVDDDGFLLVAAVDNGVNQPQGIRAFDFTAQ